MKIAQSSISFASSHSAVDVSLHHEKLVIWQQGHDRVRLENDQGGDRSLAARARALSAQTDAVSLSTVTDRKDQETVRTENIGKGETPEVMYGNLELRLFTAAFAPLRWRKVKTIDYEALIEYIRKVFGDPYGKRKNLEKLPEVDFSEAALPAVEVSLPAMAMSVVQPEAMQEGQAAGEGPVRGVEYDLYSYHLETESSRFTTQGVVQTADGKQIDISVELTMSRSYSQVYQERLRAGDALFNSEDRRKLKDPLVLNFDGPAAALSRTTFRFDIDADGAEDQISSLAPGSGFLALDKNSDGKVNDGSELFGALSGDGFADLATYDDDNNGWIDENDQIYSRLRIWTENASGEKQLLALGEKGIGALYLGKEATPFSIKDSSNVLQGEVRSSGIFLKEDGTAGTLQQLDLVA